jgi:hypothetical protein
MKMINNVLLIAVLSITSLCNGMEPEIPKKVSWKNKLKNTLLGKSSTSFNLGELPEEVQHQIFILIGQYSGAKSLKEAGKIINAFSLTNKILDNLINEPQFCYELIRVLARKYKSSDESAAKAIGTREAQRQYHLQKKLYSYVNDKNWSNFEIQIQESWEDGADINFIYKSGKTLLMQAASELNIARFDFLITEGADINYANYKGITALMVAVETASLYDLPLELQKLIIAHKNFNLNQQDIKGNTALMYAFKIMSINKTVMSINKDVVKILVDAGAHPEVANFKGLSPLKFAKKSKMGSILDLFEQAMPKKHDNK